MLTYCTNIHPGESWGEIFANVRRYVPRVKEAVSPHEPFPIGLRLSNRASLEIDAAESARFRDWCEEHGCLVRTVNGFPYGPFHGVPIKEDVYLPDWRYPERLAYTKRLATLLAGWLPPGVKGSISTVPVGFKPALAAEEWRPAVLRNLAEALEHLDRLRRESGKQIALALEPEPACLLETTEEVVDFFDSLPFGPELRDLLAVCYDCCHQALAFERPAESLRRLSRAGIRIAHVQVSSALRCGGADLGRLAGFCEPWYLHQTVGRRPDGSLLRCGDLPEALAVREAEVREWRVHFHVPVFLGELPACGTTRGFLEEILPLFDPEVPLEVETYTWTVLPPELRGEDVAESVVREIRWAQSRRRAPAFSGGTA
ncbi:MAG: metabolite traffic protein EboE [Deltaproteobacteria bacterium]|nr:metabolite traffic protein EboE [Deltaproteobacteria bacterium]